jgi:hypothetical protein
LAASHCRGGPINIRRQGIFSDHLELGTSFKHISRAVLINPEDLAERIVDQAVESLLNYTGFNEDGERVGSYETRFRKDIEAKVQKTVDANIAALAEQHIVPRVGEMIEGANMRKTNQYGEPVK